MKELREAFIPGVMAGLFIVNVLYWYDWALDQTVQDPPVVVKPVEVVTPIEEPQPKKQRCCRF